VLHTCAIPLGPARGVVAQVRGLDVSRRGVGAPSAPVSCFLAPVFPVVIVRVFGFEDRAPAYHADRICCSSGVDLVELHCE
jgi:hypothetical protein